MTINNALPNYELSTDGEGYNIYETSFVEDPATGFDFLKFNKEDVKTLEFAIVQDSTEYKRMVSGVWMMPDTKYLRTKKDANGNIELYTVSFSKDELSNALVKYLKSDYANLIKVEHQGDYLEGFVSIEHWTYNGVGTKSPVFGKTIEDLGYSADQIKEGTILKTVYVENEQFWNEEILSGKVKGFSLGGIFELIPSTQNFNDVAVQVAPEVVVQPIVEAPIAVEQPVITNSVEDAVASQQEVVGVCGASSPSVLETNVVEETIDNQLPITTPEEGGDAVVSPQIDNSAIESRFAEMMAKFDNLASSLESLKQENANLTTELNNEKSKNVTISKELAKAPIKRTQQSTPTTSTSQVSGLSKVGEYTINVGGVPMTIPKYNK